MKVTLTSQKIKDSKERNTKDSKELAASAMAFGASMPCTAGSSKGKKRPKAENFLIPKCSKTSKN